MQSRAWGCRGTVLSISPDTADIEEAQRCFQKAADVLPSDDPNRYLRVSMAVHLRDALAPGSDCSQVTST
eukprot:7181089-Prymnesium_polylepis.1